MKILASTISRTWMVLLTFFSFFMAAESSFGQTNARSCGASYRSYLKELNRETTGNNNFIEYELTVYYNGYKTYGLSNLVIGIPCGEISDYSNDKGFEMEANSTDPNSGLKGLKIDNIRNFGERRSSTNKMKVRFKLNTEGTECFVGENEINVFYKAGRSTYLETHEVDGFDFENTTTVSTATMLDNGEYCLGDIDELYVVLTGSCPWYLGYSINGENFFEVVSTEQFVIPVTVSGDYRLVSVQDENGNFGEVYGEVLIVEPPNGEILGGGTICEGDEAELIFEFDGQGPYTFTYTDGTNTYTKTSVDDRYVVVTSEPGDYQLLSIYNGICEVDGFDKIVEINTIELGAKISGGGYILPGEEATLKFELKGTGPWTVVYGNDEEEWTFETNESNYEVNTTIPGVYYIISVSNDECSTKGSGEVVVYTLPTATFVTESVELCGPNASTIQVDLTGNGPWWIVYTKDNEERIVQGIEESPYFLEVSEPGIYTLKKVYDKNQKEGLAEGSTEVVEGNLPGASISEGGVICEGDEKEIVVSLTGEGPWTFRYTYNNETESVTTAESTYSFVVEETARIEILYVSTETCSAELDGVVSEVEVLPLPTATLSGGGEFYEGESVNLEFELGGEGPWTVVYTNGTEDFTFETDEEHYSVEVSETAEWQIISVTSGDCVNEGTGTATTYLLSTVEFSGGGGILNQCSTDVDGIGLDITGMGSWVVGVRIEYPDGTIEEREFDVEVNPTGADSYVFPFEAEATYNLTSIKDKNNVEGKATGELTINIVELPGATIEGNATICTGEETEVVINLSGEGPWTLVYTINDEPQDITTSEEIVSLTISESSVIGLVSVNAEYCQTVQLEGEVEVVVKDEVSGQLSGGGGFYQGGSATLEIDLIGTAPWTVEFTDGNEIFSFNTSDAHNEIEAIAEGTYSLVSVSSDGCTVEGEGSVEVFIISTAKITTNDISLCEGETAEIVVAFTGVSPWELTYTIDNASTTIEGITDDTFTISTTSGGAVNLVSVVGGNDREGEVSGSASVTFNEIPGAEISGGGILCEGEQGAVRFDLSGTGPWTVTYTKDNIEQSFTSSDDVFTIDGADGEYALVSVSDANCSNDDLGSNVITVETIDLPTAAISGGGAICPDADAELVIDLGGVGPWTVVYSDGSTNHTIETDQSIYSFTTSVAGTYTIVSVSNSNCTNSGEGSVNVEVKDAISPNGTLTTNDAHCKDEEVFLTLDVPGAINYEVAWSTDGSGEITSSNVAGAIYVPGANDDGTVSFTATLSNECESIDMTTSTVINRVEAGFEPDPFSGRYLTGLEYSFIPVETEGDSYSWTFSDGMTQSNQVAVRQFLTPGSYDITLEVTKENCSETTVLPIYVDGNTNLYVPSVFNPDASNPENRVVKVYGEDVSESEFAFEIYNRWGLLVYGTDSFSEANSVGWLGLRKDEPQENNVFTYVLRGKFNNGDSFERTGTITMAK